MEKKFSILSPAKINLGLRILSKRKDGFHNIESIFYPIEINDRITITILKTGFTENVVKFTANNKSLENQENLCIKALKYFLCEFKFIKGYTFIIKLRKKIPIGAGLGGGSSNAASVLLILQKHFHKQLIRHYKNYKHKIKKLALLTGSDVPFFMIKKAAYVTKKGEKIKVLKSFKIRYPILIVNPGISISTKWAYNNLKIKNRKSAIWNEIKVFNKEIIIKLVNEFEETVFKKYQTISEIKKIINKSGALYSSMSGSGSTVYGIFDDKKKCNEAAKKFKLLSYTTFIQKPF